MDELDPGNSEPDMWSEFISTDELNFVYALFTEEFGDTTDGNSSTNNQ